MMKISDLKLNHIVNPVGFDLSSMSFHWDYPKDENCAASVNRERIRACRLRIFSDPERKELFYDSGLTDQINGIACELQLTLKPRTRYYWNVAAVAATGETAESPVAFFETGKLDEAWNAVWVGVRDVHDPEKPDSYRNPSPKIRKRFEASPGLRVARLYITALGLYECSLNGSLVNDGYLQPGFYNYQNWMQYQTFDVTDQIHTGQNIMEILLGDGWYKGRFGVNGGFENTFGQNYYLLCELHLCYDDGREEVIGSDRSFEYCCSPILFSNIYDGEVYDARQADTVWKPVELLRPKKTGSLGERFSLPVKVMEHRKPVKMLRDPEGNRILDMGQNMTGWIVFQCRLPAGLKVNLQFAEHMEDGRLCRKNLLTAKQEFTYISDGSCSFVRPHFTYYGFRYIQLNNFPEDVSAQEFEAWCLYSQMPATGRVTTGDALVNRFIDNAFWSQKDNFLEHPSDCPQRAERLGWTGDAQIFCGTACFQMDTGAFFRKYIKDINEEQKHYDGMVPFIVPKTKGRGFDNSERNICSSAWSDAAVIIPWTTYVYYGDHALLREQYAGMKEWTEYMIRQDQADGDKYLWQTGFHFGDWLALDNPEPGPFGRTDPFYIASCYYLYSTGLTAKAAAILGYTADEKKYGARAGRIAEAIRRSYFDERGVCRIDTQTGYVLAIIMQLTDAIQENGRKLTERIQRNQGHLDTGFVGTPLLLAALSESGNIRTAYDLLLNREKPGWLYQVLSGATTVWEAWDALDENGNLTGTASLNHYAFGSVVQWIYNVVCGIQPLEAYPGFQKIRIAPQPDRRLGSAEVEYHSAAGIYHVRWTYTDDSHVALTVDIPLAGSAILAVGKTGVGQELPPGHYEWLYIAD
jgi:alpha-L-rhamnosidase